MFQTPILLITFNRPDHTRRVLTEILKKEPQLLYVCQDGAREGNDNDILKCQEVRNLISELTSVYAEGHQNFTLYTLYQHKNLGCGAGPADGITWFFENVERGIIIEDDCLPHPDFFEYCEELLIKFNDDVRVGFIGGCNYIPRNTSASYSFSGGHHQTWGWASWRRTWSNFDYTLQNISPSIFKRILQEYCISWRQKEYWWAIYELVKYNQMNNSCWDYQFLFSCWREHQMAVTPAVNLVSNIGFGAGATHTNSYNPLLCNRSYSIMPLVHPHEISLDKNIDYSLLKQYVAPYDYGIYNVFKRGGYFVNRYIKRVLNHKGSWIKI